MSVEMDEKSGGQEAGAADDGKVQFGADEEKGFSVRVHVLEGREPPALAAEALLLGPRQQRFERLAPLAAARERRGVELRRARRPARRHEGGERHDEHQSPGAAQRRRLLRRHAVS